MMARMMISWLVKSQVILAEWSIQEPDPSAELLRAVLVLLLGWLGPLALGALVIYLLFSLPLRRRERARLFLDLIETGLAQGRSPEHTVRDAAQSRDRSPGVRFHLVAAHLESGCRLSQALARVPRFLPPQITAMLQVGESLGNLGKVIPACRAVLEDGLAQSSSVLNVMPLLFYVIIPTPLILLWFLPVFVLPKYHELMMDFAVEVPYVYQVVFNHAWLLSCVATLLLALLAGSFLVYWGGPRLQAWARSMLGPIVDEIAYRVPWRRRRLQRDFVRMFALLLDAELAEDRAVLLAAEATANAVMLRQAERVAEDLRQGAALPKAMQRMERCREFEWRLANAVHGPRQFTRALSGWSEALDAQAFQQEQTAVQLLTTGFVLVNGLMVGLIFVGVFSFLVQLIDNVMLW
jgi:type II secretory pathway component PulF